MKWNYLVAIVLSLFILSSCAQPPVETPTPPPTEEPKLPAEEAPPTPTPTPTEKAPMPSEITTSGHITRDETWSGTVLITGDVWVNEGVTLTIEPGTTVKFKHWRPGYIEPFRRIGLYIEGTLRAIGTPEKPIRFTSDAPRPEHSDWRTIQIGSPDIRPSNGNILDYGIVEFGRAGVSIHYTNFTLSNSIVRWSQGANVWLDHSSSTITRNRIYGAGHDGIGLANSNPTISYNTISGNGVGIVNISTSNPIIRHNIVENNRRIGILIRGLSAPVIEYNNITQNIAEGGINMAGSNSTIRYNNIYSNGGTAQLHVEEGDAIITNNWWGTSGKEEVESSIGVLKGSASYEPFLTSPVDIGEITYDYENLETYVHPPATEKDIFPYFTPSDETRRIVSSWSTVDSPTGIAWDGEYLWVVTTPNKWLLKYDTGGRLIDSLAAPGSLPIALAFDGQYLWSLDFSEQLAYQFDFSGKVINSIAVPVGHWGEGGLAYDGEYLWTAPRRKLHKIDTSGNIVDVVQIQAEINVNGMAWDGEHLWVSDKDLNDRIFKVDPTNGQVIGWINTPGDETWGMTWFNNYLWACEWTNDWDNYLVVKMEPIPQPFE